jgi:hypothetical protein
MVQAVDLNLLLPMAIFGLLLGWGLAALPWPGWPAGGIILGFGVIVVLGRIGRLDGVLLALLGALLQLAWDAWHWPRLGPPDSAAVLSLLATLGQQLNTLVSRLWGWLIGLVLAEPTFDPVAVALVWSLGMWLVAAWAGWLVRRRDHPILALLPAGALLVISQAYAGGNFAFLLLLLAITWMLLALVGHSARERRWQAAGIDFSLDIRLDLLVVTVWLTLVLTTLAGLTPTFSIRQVAEAAQRLIWGQPLAAGPVASSLGLKAPPGPPTLFDQVQRGGLPRQHLLGAGPELSQQPVMRIHATILDTTIQPASLQPALRWRSLTYDRYTGQGWLSGKTDIVAYSAGEPVNPQTFDIFKTAKVLIRQEVQLAGNPGSLVHVAGVLLAIDQPYQVAWRSSGDMFGATVEAAGYQADSLLLPVSQEQLRAAGNRYPTWVQRRYLALPSNLPDRVRGLARDLTATAPTPYDRAKAIETYLRAIPYNLNIAQPPPNRDVVDYFLFDLRQGYCDYYASAMVVLARAAGLPARLVVGYSGGSYDAVAGRYLISAANAHSWPEIYFPNYGWIEFEPTAGQPALFHPAEPLPLTPAPALTPPLAAPMAQTGFKWGWAVVAGLAGLALAGRVWALADAWSLRRLPPQAASERLYARLRWYSRRLIGPATAGKTPYEFSLALAERVSDLTAQPRWRRWLGPAPAEIEQLTQLYVQLAYSPHPAPAEAKGQAIQTWQRLRLRLWLAWGLQIIGLRLASAAAKFAQLNPPNQLPTR